MTYEGICRGGPYDGQWLAHSHKQLCIAQHPPMKAGFVVDKPPDHIEIKYSHYHYVLAQWIWRE